MNSTVYKQAILAAKNEIVECLKQKQAIDAKIKHLANVISANAQMLRDSERDAEIESLSEMTGEQLGFTDAIREVLNSNSGFFFNAIGVRDRLRDYGFPLESYTNPLASIHTILKRLFDKGELKRQTNSGDVFYSAAPKGLPPPPKRAVDVYNFRPGTYMKKE